MTAVRPAASTDAGALAGLVAGFPTPTPPSADAFARAFHAKLADPKSCQLVAEQDGQLVGYVSGYCHPTFYARGQTAWVDEILVDESSRGRGLGRLLMEAFEEWARGHDCVLVSLATRGTTGFYEHLGYSSRASYYKKYLAGD